MSLWSAVEFETYEGWRKYIVREWSAANRSLLNEDRVGKDDFPEIGNYVAAEDWGDNERGPYRSVQLLRASFGWVEAQPNPI